MLHCVPSHALTPIHVNHSENCPQSKNQQQFNNRLVGIIYSTALQCGYTFDPESFGCSEAIGEADSIKSSAAAPSTPTDETMEYLDCVVHRQDTSNNSTSSFNYKKLRDRIRCYYKTHVQNSKKRLITLLKNPTRPKNREILIKVVDEVRDRASRDESMGTVGRRQLSPNGKAALLRLEEKEQSLLLSPMNSSSCVITPNLGMTTPSARNSSTLRGREDGHGSICRSAPSSSSSSSTGLSSNSCKECWHESPPKWHAPPPTRRVPMDSGRQYGDLDAISADAPQFASPCKLEHAAMLTSIRQAVPSRVL